MEIDKRFNTYIRTATAYGSAWPETLAASEAVRPGRIGVVSMVTPNDGHAAICHAFLSRGIPVICDKPLCTATQDARSPAELLGRTGLPFVLTHTDTGCPQVREARAPVLAGELGTIRVMQLEYPLE